MSMPPVKNQFIYLIPTMGLDTVLILAIYVAVVLATVLRFRKRAC